MLATHLLQCQHAWCVFLDLHPVLEQRGSCPVTKPSKRRPPQVAGGALGTPRRWQRFGDAGRAAGRASPPCGTVSKRTSTSRSRVRVHRDDEVVDAVHLDAVSRVEHQRDDFEALSGRESTMDPVLEDALVKLLVDLPADADVPIVASGPERTWIWSDLHPSDPSVLLGWGRPFRSVEEMNRHLLRNWRRRVGAGRHHHLPRRRRPSGCLAGRSPDVRPSPAPAP